MKLVQNIKFLAVPVFILFLTFGCGSTSDSGIVTSKAFIPAHTETIPSIGLGLDGEMEIDYEEYEEPDRWIVRYRCGERDYSKYITKEEYEKINIGDIFGTSIEK